MARGAGKRATALKFNTSEDSVWRHWAKHVSENIKAARKVEILKPGAELRNLVVDESRGLLEGLSMIRGALYRQLDTAVEVDDRSAVASLSRALHENLTIVGRATGELLAHQSALAPSVTLQADYLELRNQLIAALRPFPDARAAVAAVFRRSEDQAASAIRALSASPAPATGATA
ncbi:MAG TPA: hypothetical protein VGF92_07425 [Stellaceae bacterium]